MVVSSVLFQRENIKYTPISVHKVFFLENNYHVWKRANAVLLYAVLFYIFHSFNELKE